MGDAEASHVGKTTMPHRRDAKPHDTRPETQGHALDWHPAQRPIVKRSIQRAYARSLDQGIAWYRGRCYTPADFPKQLQLTYKPKIKVSQPSQHCIIHCNQKHQDARRFRILNWNASGLSVHKLDAIKVWLLHQQIEAAFITETRWTFESTWMDDNFHYVHTGNPDERGAGILCILARSFCNSNRLRWRTVQPGRLLHLQAQMDKRCIDLVGCYQYTTAATRARTIARAQFWEQLDQFLHGLVLRNILVLAGDFNCDLLHAASHSGPAHFSWRNSQTSGAKHSDNGRFTSLLREHGLSALNTWHPGLGPTFIHADACSRIDFIITRKHVADGVSKAVTYAWDAPFTGDSGHVPMMAQIRKQWYNPKQHSEQWGVTPAQRTKGHAAYMTNSNQWQAFTEQATTNLTACLDDVTTSDDDLIPTLHQVAIQCFHEFFPLDKPNRNHFDETTTNLVMSKWQHRREFLRLTRPTARNLFQAWRHWTKFVLLNKQSKQHAKQLRKIKFAEVIQQAQNAAHRHDSHTLFSIINKHAPKQSRRKMQLRNAQGHLASPIEETALLKRFIMDTWEGPPTFPTDVPPCSGMPFSLRELEAEMCRIPASKAVARPCAPGTVWRSVATSLAPLLYAKLEAWWHRPEPFLPSMFRDAWMILIPKPNKQPVHPRALRPLALQDPISKSIVGLLTRIAQREAYPQFTMLPIWAYLPGRSTQDALRRVSQHCRDAQVLMNSLRSSPFTRQQGTQRYLVAGGLQLFLDIERAFDMVSRESLFTKLGELGINPQIVLLLSLWHQNTKYHLNSNGEDHPIPVWRGVRQGCCAAPLLWNGYMWLFLVELSRAVGLEWVLRCLNVYADDCQMGDLFHSHAELKQLMHNIATTIELLTSFGLTINPAKCTVLLTMGGTNFRKLRASLTTWRDGKEWFCFTGTANQKFWVPLASSAKYLGTIITYKNMEDKTAFHRVQLARIAFSRLRRWLTGPRGLSTRQRLQLFTTCIYPILQYGILAIGLTSTGLQHIQKHMYGMLRQVLNNHAYVTGHSHQDALAQNRVAPPIAWLLDSIDSLQRSLHNRAANANSTDIIHQLDWTHLDCLKITLHEHLSAGPEYLVQPVESEVPSALYTCQQCDFSTPNVAHFRRHCTVTHAQSMYRTHPADPKRYMLHGLPQCKFCFQKYTTWRSFCIHIQRGCQVLIAGPAGCWTQPDRPLVSDPALTPAMFTDAMDNPVRGSHPLTDADLRNLLNQEWGSRVLTIVSSRNWHHMLKETVACQYMATRCCLCDQFLGRIQDLHRHYKLQHPEYWPHVQTKGIQLSNLHNSEEPPCRYCNWPFKTSHQCPIWLQLAMLLIYGGGVQNPAQSPAIQRCEICAESFSNSESLHAHLVSEHRLISSSFNAARDSLEGEPVCAHCNTMYDNMESLRSHISQSRCLNFDPALPTEVIDVRPEWIEALCQGKLADHLRNAHVRLQLTLRCQHCRAKYTRPADLSGHLQASHGSLWSAAQPLTGHLVALLYEQTGCLCNPSISSHRSHHTCLPLTQLSMLYMRLTKPILYIHVPTEEELTHMYSRHLQRDQIFLLEKAITDGPPDMHWKNSQMVTLLRDTCVLCAAPMHPADLVIHLHEVHNCRQPLIKFLIQQPLPHYVAEQENDFQCFACAQVYNTPAADDTSDTAAARLQATQAHLRAQCPHLLQTAIIFVKAASGTYGRRRNARSDRDDRADLDSFPEHGTADRQDTEIGAEQSCNQAPKKEGHNQSDAAQALPSKINLALAMTQLAKLALQLDREMQLMKKEDTFLFFFGNKGNDSCLHLLMQTTETWAKEHQAQKQANQVTTMIPLRLKLMQVLFTTLLKKLDQLGAAEPGSELLLMAQKNLVLLPDKTCPYLEWDHQNKRLRASQKRPLTLKHVHQLCNDMLEALSDINLVAKFHSLPISNNTETTTWKLQLSMRQDQPWQLMQMLSHSAIWLLMGGSLKPHSLVQSPVAHQLQHTLGMSNQGKGRGKGKTKTKSKTAKREEPWPCRPAIRSLIWKVCDHM